MNITGEFDVELKPIDGYSQGSDGVSLGRMSINKTFKGKLNGTSKGEMLSAMTATQGSAGYVAIEQVVRALNGESGSFVLQHFGIMHAGKDRLILEVVPESGTGKLKGLSGNMTISIDKGKHFYEFNYELG